ncbi:MAG: hypothetical protein HY903_01005 [Deltaproteobacteria bacterium]|nr:hypothetical protein [Deltaproteobacteria bacterium]
MGGKRRRAWSLGPVGTVALSLATACGASPGTAVRVTVTGMTTEAATEPDDADDDVPLGHDTSVYEALLRLGKVTLHTDGDPVASGAAVNVNLLATTTLFEAEVGATALRNLTVEVPPPSGDGVRRGESVSVFAAGVMNKVAFTYRDQTMDAVDVELEAELGAAPVVVAVLFDLTQWFKDVDSEGLEPDEVGEYRLDDEHNDAVALGIEANIRASVSAHVGDKPTTPTGSTVVSLDAGR